MSPPNFKPIPKTADELAQQVSTIQQFASERFVPSLVPTPPPESVVATLPNASTQSPEPTPPSNTSTEQGRGPTQNVTKASDTPTPDQFRRLALTIPADIYDQIETRSNTNRSTIRYVILRALKADNFDIPEAELKKDKRRPV